MKGKKVRDSFSKKEMNELGEEAKKRWGHTAAYKESEENVRKMTKDQMDAVKQEGHDILLKGATLVGEDVHSADVQDLITEHYKHLSNFYKPNPEMYRGLAEMYITDSRFVKYFETFHPDLPQFMHDAMIVFIENM